MNIHVVFFERVLDFKKESWSGNKKICNKEIYLKLTKLIALVTASRTIQIHHLVIHHLVLVITCLGGRLEINCLSAFLKNLKLAE